MGEYADLQIERDIEEMSKELMKELNQPCPTTHHNRKPHHKLVTCGLCGKKVKTTGIMNHKAHHAEEDAKPREVLTDPIREDFELWALDKKHNQLYPLHRSFHSKGMYYNNRTQLTWEGFKAAKELSLKGVTP